MQYFARDRTLAQCLLDFQLIEQIDNANSECTRSCQSPASDLLHSADLEKLKMWEPLHSLLTSPNSSEAIQMQTLWILGTAVQNNPAAQNSVRPFSSTTSALDTNRCFFYLRSTSRSPP